MMNDQVRRLSHQMRLFGIHEAAERRAAEAVANGLHPLEFLRLLLEDEALSRKDRVAKALLTKARFRFRADLEDWDPTVDRGLSRPKLAELAALSFLHNHETLILVGKTGLGKTHLAIAIGKRLCQEGHGTLFVPVSHLFEEIAAARAAGRYLAYLKHLGKQKALILDDFGLRTYTHEEATALMDILEARYRQSATLVTSQVDPKGWLKLFEDPVIAEAIVDRLIHPSQKILLKGEKSYREHLGPAKKDKE